VGSHVLIGAAVACLMWQFFGLVGFLVVGRENIGASGGLNFIEGTRQWIGGHATHMGNALGTGLGFFFALFCVRTICKRDWLAAAVASLLGIWLEGGIVGAEHWQINAALDLTAYFALFLVMLRFGLIATISTIFFFNSFQAIVLGLDWTAWYAPYGLATLALTLAIAIGAFRLSLGSRSLFGDEAATSAASG
jgi:hypothetical protein